MARKERLFNPLKRKVLRKKITTSEIAFGAGFVLLLGLSTWWVAAQKDNFDPADRDISFETLENDSTGEQLYNEPLKRWVEPGTAVAGAAVPVDLGPFAPGLLDGGWQVDGRVETYDPSNVYEKINGAAEQYIAFGFRQLDYVTIASGQDFINIELYDQGDFANVLGLFSAQRDAGREVLTAGDIYYYETPVGMIGGYGNYFFKIAASGSGPALLDKAAQVLSTLTGLPARASRPPLPFTVLTRRLEVSFEGLAYERQDVFQYEFMTDCWFGTVPDGTGGGDSRYFIHLAGDDASAAALHAQLEKEQGYEYEQVEKQGDRVLFRHEYLGTFFAMDRQGAAILGIDGAATADAARTLLDRLGEALREETKADPEA